MSDRPPAGNSRRPVRPAGAGEALRAIVGSRLGGALFSLAGVLLIVAGLLALWGNDDSDQGRGDPALAEAGAQQPDTPESAGNGGSPSDGTTTDGGTPTSTPPTGTTPPPRTAAPPPPPPPSTEPAPARAPLTVLNNSRISGLGSDVASRLRSGGWPVVHVGNFTGRVPATTAYFTPGNAAEERAAQELARQFPEVERVLPRFDGLPPGLAGVIVVVTRHWVA